MNEDIRVWVVDDDESIRWVLERSLTRLGVDSVDLIQLHNLVEPDEWEVAHGPGGAVEALSRARDEGLVRFIGVTGHGLRIAGMHLRSLERFDFTSVLLPYNYALMSGDQYRADVETLLGLCELALAVGIQHGATRSFDCSLQPPRSASTPPSNR